MRVGISCVAAVLLAVLGGTAMAASGSPNKRPDHREFCGTVVRMAEASCVGLKAAVAGDPDYDITGAKPVPQIGDLISGSGDLGHGMGICTQGTHLTAVTWKNVVACPAAK